ncbi:hypothetical protein DAEQUDRAFT_654765, partial [Daedalea quercina L-15889]
MDINAMAPKERQRNQELGLCFYCHKQGHLFRQQSCALQAALRGFLKGSENSTHSDQRPYALHISHVVTGITQSKALYIPLTVRGVHKDVDIEALIDSGAMATYIHPRLVIRLCLSTTPLARPIPIFNVDDTPNKKGSITHSVALRY